MKKDEIVKRSANSDIQLKKENSDLHLEKYSIMNCIENFGKIKTPLAAYSEDCPTLATVKKCTEKGYVIKYIMAWLINLNDYMNLNKKLNENQIGEIAHYIYQDYHYFKMSDLYYLFSEIKRGSFGEMYGSLDGVKIMKIFESYDNSRKKAVFEDGLTEHSKHKGARNESFREVIYYNAKANKG